MSGLFYSHMPMAETGSGLYKRTSMQTGEFITSIKDRILKVLELIAVQGNNDNRVFAIGAYATADGSSSMFLIRDIIGHTRKNQGGVAVKVIYEDQASSDPKGVFSPVHGLIPDSYTCLNDFSKVFLMATGTSLYCQVLPDNTADFILCLAKVRWMAEE